MQCIGRYVNETMKPRSINVLAVVLILLLAVGAVCPISAAADSAQSPELSTVDGASVRISATSALRFAGSISCEAYDRLGDASFGLLITDADNVDGLYSFTVASLEQRGLAYLAEPATPVLEDECYRFYAVIDNIGSANYARCFAARAFVRLGSEYIYADDYTVRSVGRVAHLAAEDIELGDKDGNAFGLEKEALVDGQPANVYSLSGKAVTPGLFRVDERFIFLKVGDSSVKTQDAIIYSRYSSTELEVLNGIVESGMARYSVFAADLGRFDDSLETLHHRLAAEVSQSSAAKWTLQTARGLAKHNMEKLCCFDYTPLVYSAYRTVDGEARQLYWADDSRSHLTLENTGMAAMVEIDIELQLRMELMRLYIAGYDGLMYGCFSDSVKSCGEQLRRDYDSACASLSGNAAALEALKQEYDRLCERINGSASEYLASERGADDYFSAVCDFNMPDRATVTLADAASVVTDLDAGVDAYAAFIAGFNAAARRSMADVAAQAGVVLNFN